MNGTQAECRAGLLRAHYPVVAAMLLYFAGVLFVQPFADVPLMDDWVYARDVVRSVERGALTLLGIESAWGLPQVWLGTLLKPARQVHVQLRGLNIAVSLLSIVLLYLLLLRASRNRPLLLLLLAGCAVFPPFFLGGLTFMSDQLFLLLVIVVSLLLHEAARRRSAVWLAAGAAFCLAALLQRQYGVLFALPLLLVAFARPRRGALAAVGVVGAALLVLTLVFAGSWVQGRVETPVPPGGPWSQIRFNLVYLALLANALVFFTGLLVAPAFLALGRWRRPNPWFYLPLAALAGLAAVRLALDVNAPFVGNLFSAYGVFREHEVLMGAREVNLPLALRVVGSLLGLCFVVPALSRLAARMQPGATAAFLRGRPECVAPLLFGVLYAGALASRTVFFDRYYLPLLPAALFAAALLLDDARFGRRMALGLGAALALMVFSATTVRDYFSWNAAKWELAGRALPRLGSVEELDGGYEWNGWNGKTSAAHPRVALKSARHFLSFSPQRGARVVDAAEWRSIWPPHERKIFVIEKKPAAPR